MLAQSPYQALGLAAEHHNLTHRSENNIAGLGVMIPLLFDLIDGAEPKSAAADHAKQLRIPRVAGSELFAMYRDHDGPGNIPKDKAWRLHTDLSERPFDMEALVRNRSETEVTRGMLATACYPEHGLPMLLYLAYRHDFDLEKALIANTNAGGDNVHRGMLLGLLVGAACDEIPGALAEGLIDADALKEEIGAFADIAAAGKGV